MKGNSRASLHLAAKRNNHVFPLNPPLGRGGLSYPRFASIVSPFGLSELESVVS
jgi:hypothetical protein